MTNKAEEERIDRSSGRRILFIGSVAYPHGSAAAKRLSNMGEAFFQKGWLVDVVTYGQPEVEGCESLEWGGQHARTAVLKYSGVAGKLESQYLSGLSAARFLKKEANLPAGSIVYIYGYLFSATVPLILAAKKMGLTVFMDVNEVPASFEGFGGKLSINYWNLKLGYYVTPRLVDCVVAISQHIENEIASRSSRVLRVPAVESFHGKSKQKTKVKEGGKVRLLYIGKFLKRDMPELMLEVCGKLAENGYAFELSLVGDYQNAKGARSLITEAFRVFEGLESRVKEYGRVDDATLEALIDEADLAFLLRRDHPAERASFPTRLVEYAVRGLPTITTNVEDVSYYLKDGTHGIFLNGNSVGSSSRKLGEALEDKDKILRMSENFRALGVSEFSSDRHVEALIQIANNLNSSK